MSRHVSDDGYTFVLLLSIGVVNQYSPNIVRTRYIGSEAVEVLILDNTH